MPSDFKRGTDGDLLLEGGNFSTVSGREAVAQLVKSRLESFTEEWFLNLDYGAIDKEEFFTKAPSLSDIAALRKLAILSVPGVSALASYRISLDNVSRALVEVIGILTEDDAVVQVTATSSSVGSIVVILLS
tara:strand:- start:1179 stop:1574 length:396 start_codon:yes stop_codon:yes gene_type:complete